MYKVVVESYDGELWEYEFETKEDVEEYLKSIYENQELNEKDLVYVYKDEKEIYYDIKVELEEENE